MLHTLSIIIPLEVPDAYTNQFSFIDDHDWQYYHAMIKYLDDIVGELVITLKNKSMWDNALLVVPVDSLNMWSLIT